MATMEQLAKAKVAYQKVTQRGRRTVRHIQIHQVDVPGSRVLASIDGEPSMWYFPNNYRDWSLKYPRLP